MFTKMTETDWAVALEVFRASLSRRGAKGRDDRLFLEALHYFSVHNITWRALPERFGNVRNLLRPPRLALTVGTSGADVRLHRGARACVGRRGKRGQEVRRSAARAAASPPKST